MRKLTIGKNDAGQRLDKFLHKYFKPPLPSALLYKFIRKNRVKVNGRGSEPGRALREGDALELYINDAMFDDSASFVYVKPDFGVAYEDGNILVADKKAGTVSHDDDAGTVNTLAAQIISYLADKGEYVPAGEQSFAPALCNRLDRNTSGLVIAAKNAAALREMNYIIKHRLLRKFYYALVTGAPDAKKAELNGWLLKDEKENKVRVYDREVPGASRIITRYEVIEADGDGSLLEVELVTGRTHQIRAHLASIGHPVAGDGKYGVAKRGEPLMLHSRRIVFLENNCAALGYLNGIEIISKTHGFFDA